MELKERRRLAQKQRYASKEGRAYHLIEAAKLRCKRKKSGTVSIDPTWVLAKLETGVCELTGIPFDFSTPNVYGFNRNPYAPSIDRIDSSNPNYTEANCRLIIIAANTALNEFGLEFMKPIFKKLAEH